MLKTAYRDGSLTPIENPDAICPNDEDMPQIAPGACGSRLTVSSETTVYTVMNNLIDQVPQATIPYEFEPGFTQEVQIAYPIQIRFPDLSAPSPAKQTLSTGAIIGIAFGGFFSLFFAFLVGVLVLRRRKKNGEGDGVVDQRRPSAQFLDAPQVAESGYSDPAFSRSEHGTPVQVQRKPVAHHSWDERVSFRELRVFESGWLLIDIGRGTV